MTPEANDRLASAHRTWMELPFPPGRSVDALDELKSELAYIDAVVAEATAQLRNPDAGGDTSVPAQARAELSHILMATSRPADDAGRKLLKEYQTYARALEAVIDTLPCS